MSQQNIEYISTRINVGKQLLSVKHFTYNYMNTIWFDFYRRLSLWVKPTVKQPTLSQTSLPALLQLLYSRTALKSSVFHLLKGVLSIVLRTREVLGVVWCWCTWRRRHWDGVDRWPSQHWAPVIQQTLVRTVTPNISCAHTHTHTHTLHFCKAGKPSNLTWRDLGCFWAHFKPAPTVRFVVKCVDYVWF